MGSRQGAYERLQLQRVSRERSHDESLRAPQWRGNRRSPNPPRHRNVRAFDSKPYHVGHLSPAVDSTGDRRKKLYAAIVSLNTGSRCIAAYDHAVLESV